MGVNDELSPREHDDLRSTVLAGARRIKPVGAHRTQLIAASVALVLVAGVAGGAWATASLLGSGPVPAVTSPSPTPTSTPTPEPTEPSEPAPRAAVLPFGGECANVLDLEWLSESFGETMVEEPEAWPEPEVMLAGGIDCAWSAEGMYVAPSIHVRAYPSADIDVEKSALAGSCEDATSCSATQRIDDTWISVTTLREGSDAEWLQVIVDELADRVAGFPPPVRAERAPGWWSTPTCDEITDVLPEGWAERMSPLPTYEPPSHEELAVFGIRLTEPSGVNCAQQIAPSSEQPGNMTMNIVVVPGGAVAFEHMESSEGARAVEVQGAERAVLVSDNDRWEGYAPAAVLRVGDNVLILRGDNGLPPEDLLPLGPPLIEMLNARAG